MADWDSIPRAHVREAARTVVLQDLGEIPVALRAAAGCDAYEPIRDEAGAHNRCGAPGVRFVYFPWGYPVVEPDGQSQPYGLGSLCLHHVRAGTLHLRRPPQVRSRPAAIAAYAASQAA